MWESSLAKNQQDNQNKRGRSQIQKEEVIYSHNIDRNIVGTKDYLQTWESWGLELTTNQKFYRLVFKYSALPLLLLQTKKRKKDADQTATNTLTRMTRRKIKKKKKKKS